MNNNQRFAQTMNLREATRALRLAESSLVARAATSPADPHEELRSLVKALEERRNLLARRHGRFA